MLKNYLKVAFRSILKNKVFSAINIVGLAIGMASCIVIMLFVSFEKSFDSIHTRNLYRLDEVQKFEGMVAPQKVALSMFPMGPTLKSEFPEIREFVRIRPMNNVHLNIENRRIDIEKGLWGDENFFSMFGYKLLKGDVGTVLKEPNAVVLSERTAQSIFGNQDPIGKSFARYDRDTTVFKVSGIMENVGTNSHLQFDAVFAFNTMIKPDFMNNWGGNWLVTYLDIAPGTDIKALEAKFPAYLKRHMNGDGWKFYELFLQSLPDVHAGSSDITHDYLNFQKFDRRYTYVFSLIAAIVLAIASVNFMNLSTARSAGRAKEVGIRKSVGAQRFQLSGQFIGESIMLSFMALVLALLIVVAVLPYMSNFSQRELSFPFFTNAALFFGILGGTVLIGALSGIYPAVFLSAFQPIKVLKGKLDASKSNFRNVLVIVQFSSAIFLMIGTGFAVRQLRFMQDKDPGFQRAQVVVIPLDFKSNPKYQSLKNEFLNSPYIESVSASGQRIGNNFHQTGVVFHGDGPKREIASSQVVVDHDYLTLYKMKLIAGRNFRDDAADNATAYIVNETMAKELLKGQRSTDMQSLLGRNFGFGGMDSTGRIVGVVADFNFNSLHNKIETLCLFNQKDWGYSEISVRIKGNNATQAIAAMRNVWQQQVPDREFDYTFLDQHFAELYQADAQVSEIVGILAGLAIFVACLGLFGLASYSAERRVKEIGVRKVLGASTAGIVALLSKDFVRLILVSLLIAIPAGWWAIHVWLNGFAYRISIDWWVFALSGILAIGVAVLTISTQSIRAALTNPMKSLRSE